MNDTKSTGDGPRKPRVFRLDDARLEHSPPAATEELSANGGEVPYVPVPLHQRGFRWGSLLLAALGGLLSLAISIWIWDFVSGLFSRGGWLGAVALILAAVFVVAVLMIVVREASGIFRLSRVVSIRTRAEAALLNGEKPLAQAVSLATEKLFVGREDAAWSIRAMREHRQDVRDGRELLILTERELIMPLDARVQEVITDSVRRVAMITAVSPSAIVDV